MNVALRRAYELERKGLEFYINSAGNSSNALVKRTIFSLAKEEIAHMVKIDEISLSLDTSGKWIDEEIGFKSSDIEIELKKFFEKTEKEILDLNKDNADLIKKAMEFERKSYELYDDLGKKAGSNIEKRFYDELKKQEESHFDALQNVYYYLTKTGDWLQKDESNVWGWMNL
jgi:rubrerythrin